MSCNDVSCCSSSLVVLLKPSELRDRAKFVMIFWICRSRRAVTAAMITRFALSSMQQEKSALLSTPLPT
jgi:hypothetical protein